MRFSSIFFTTFLLVATVGRSTWALPVPDDPPAVVPPAVTPDYGSGGAAVVGVAQPSGSGNSEPMNLPPTVTPVPDANATSGTDPMKGKGYGQKQNWGTPSNVGGKVVAMKLGAAPVDDKEAVSPGYKGKGSGRAYATDPRGYRSGGTGVLRISQGSGVSKSAAMNLGAPPVDAKETVSFYDKDKGYASGRVRNAGISQGTGIAKTVPFSEVLKSSTMNPPLPVTTDPSVPGATPLPA